MKFLKSAELKNLKRINSKDSKKVLLINPKKRDINSYPHNALAILAGILKKRGHETLIIDYSFLRFEKDISFFINDFKPDVIGISIYTLNANEAEKLIDKINETVPHTPILVGGPHVTLYPDLLKSNHKIDYVFTGEAELTILGVVENAKKEKAPQIISAKELVDLNDIPLPDYKAFYKWETIRGYPIMTSRGCPYGCSFCAGVKLSQRRWRLRDIDDCINELEIAKKTISPNIITFVFDDCPTVRKDRFNHFLRLFLDKIKTEILVINTRADCIDEEFLSLLKKCKVDEIGLGVEHAHPEVFRLINKGESLEQIEKACRLVKKNGIKLFLSFVIGLPNDNVERTKASIRFARRVKADRVGFNPIIPYRGTDARKWFEENGATFYNEIGSSEKISYFECEEPYVETADFTKDDRKKAYYMFGFMMNHFIFTIGGFPRMLAIVRKYGLYREFFYYLPRGLLRTAKRNLRFATHALKIFQKEGFSELFRRYKARNRLKMPAN